MGRHAWLFCAVATRAGLLELGGQLGLELLEREGAESPWAGIAMRDADGKAFVCRSGSPAAREPEPGPKTLSEALGQLDGSCAYLNQGWWTYEWCHRRHVRQFHLEAQARSPEWSLGDYTRTELEDDDGGAASSVDAAGSEALSRAVDVFDVGGQRCDETGTGRSSTVHFRCCDGPKPGKATKGKRKRAAGAEAFITSVDEVALCSYAFAVCSPSLCSPSSPNATASLLLKALEGVCLQRHEGWWSFEFCYKKGARQFHARLPRVETTPPPRPPSFSGSPRSTAWASGSASRAWASRRKRPRSPRSRRATTARAGSSRTSPRSSALATRRRTRAAARARVLSRGIARRTHISLLLGAEDDAALVVERGADGWDKARVEVEYERGTPCDIGEDDDSGEKRRRGTTARLVCGDTNALVSVVEDRTCHYVFTVTTPALCKHAAFATAPNTRPVTCEAAPDDES